MQIIETDVAVLGGGSAGCAAVHRLLTSGCSAVTLIEAGPDYGPRDSGAWPEEVLDATMIPHTHDWGWSEPTFGRNFLHSRAKVIGGCSSHNECAAVWGLASDYDEWAALVGDDSWTWAALAESVGAIESASPAHDARGREGVLRTRRYVDDEMTRWGSAFEAAATQNGYATASDIGDFSAAGIVARWYTNSRDGIRWNTGFAFLDPHRNDSRLAIRAGVTVDRLLFDGKRATAAIVIDASGEPFELRARSFVLTAGAIGTPAILLRSGVGPADDLRELGIAVVADVPGVGRGLQDHVGIGLAYGLSDADRDDFAQRVADHTVVQSQVVVRTAKGPESAEQIHLLPYEVPGPEGEWLHLLVAFLMNPTSEGSVRLRASDPAAAPLINAGYLRAAEDLGALIEAVSLLRELAAQPAFANATTGEMAWSRDLTGTALGDYVKHSFVTYGHLGCSVRIGIESDPLAAADSSGRVRGTANVIVADVSAMPKMLSANTNLTAMLMGYKLAASALSPDAIADRP